MPFASLPPEVNEMIVDAACRVRSNGKVSSNLQLTIRTQHLPSRCQDEVIRWVLRCLDDNRLEYIKDYFGQYEWRVVSNIRNEINAKTETDGDVYYPEIVVAIRIGRQVHSPFENHRKDEYDLVVLDENPPKLQAEVSADIFKIIIKDIPPPTVVTAVGISGVSDDFMMALWSEIIAKESNFDVNGRGYMVHPMWMKFDNGWNAIREKSFNFGWKGYAPIKD